jgi:hypothetical protein
VYLFGFPQSVYADIRTTREHSLVDDWIDIYCIIQIRVRLKLVLFEEAIPAYAIHGKRVFPETAGMTRNDLKLGKQIWTVGERSIEELIPKLTAK